MGIKEMWGGITRELKRNKGGYSFIFGYAVFIVVIGLFGLDLDFERDRSWFQGLIAFGLALFIFVQFNLDYRNQRRNILYEKQIDALMEFHSIINDMVTVMTIGNIESLSAIDSIKKVVQRHDEFKNRGKDQFVSNIAKRSSKMSYEELFQRIYRIDSLCRFFEKTGFNPTEIFDIRREITTWEVISFETKKLNEMFKTLEVSIGDLIGEMIVFTLELRFLIDEELGIL